MEELEQGEIESALRRVFGPGLPTAFYQLPRVTGNEMAPETVRRQRRRRRPALTPAPRCRQK